MAKIIERLLNEATVAKNYVDNLAIRDSVEYLAGTNLEGNKRLVNYALNPIHTGLVTNDEIYLAIVPDQNAGKVRKGIGNLVAIPTGCIAGAAHGVIDLYVASKVGHYIYDSIKGIFDSSTKGGTSPDLVPKNEIVKNTGNSPFLERTNITDPNKEVLEQRIEMYQTALNQGKDISGGVVNGVEGPFVIDNNATGLHMSGTMGEGSGYAETTRTY